MRLVRLLVLALVLVSSRLGYCQSDQVLLGAGATFPYPLYEKWIDYYNAETGVRITYEPVGSGGGIHQIKAREVDFGGSDAYLPDEELVQNGNRLVHIPTCLGAVAITYNLPGDISLRLTPDILADVFLGNITAWSDPDIKAVQVGQSLPDLPITIVRRADSSGTTFILTDYMSKVSPIWTDRIGRGKKVNWRVGLGADGNPGVAETVSRIPGSLGYVEMTYAYAQNLSIAAIQNKAGNFIRPDVDTASNAAAIEIPDDMRVMLTDTSAEDGYPISGLTYLLVYSEQAYGDRTLERAHTLVGYLKWVLTHGQAYTSENLYAPLPQEVIDQALEALGQLTYAGQPLWEPSF